VSHELQFMEKSHRYKMRTPQGVLASVPGVTGLIGGGIPKPALNPWYARMVAEFVDQNPLEVERLRSLPPVQHNGRERSALVDALCKVPTGKRDTAAERGTAIHALAEKVVAGDEVAVPVEHDGEVTGYAEFLDTWDITPLVVEGRGANATEWFAGTFDLVGTSPHLAGGKPIMIDLKTSNGVYGETALQTAAYANFEFYLDADGQEHPMPEIHACYVAHITPFGTDLHPLCRDRGELAEAYRQFLCAAYTTKCQKRRNAFLGEPLPQPNQAAPVAA
jgi:hypothetical protein